MIPFKNRFHGHNSLDYTYKNSQTTRSRLVNVKSVVNKKRTDSRVAVVIGKKVVKSAVRRNLARRRVYEYIRPKIADFTNIYDVVITITSSALLSVTHAELAAQLNQLLIQAQIIKK